MKLFLEKNRIGMAKIQSVAGTAESLTSADATTRWTSLELSSLDVEQIEVPVMDGIMSAPETIVGTIKGTITGDAYIAEGVYTATGVTGSPVWTGSLDLGKYFKAGGCSVTEITPTDEITNDGAFYIVPDTTSCEFLTQAIVDSPNQCGGATFNGIAYTLRDAKTNLSLSADSVGQGIMLKVETVGAVDGIVDIANIPLFSGEGQEPIARFVNTDITLTPVQADGAPTVPPSTPIVICSSDLTFDLNNNLVDVMCQSASDGIAGSIITEKTPTLAITPLLDNLAVYDWWNGLKDSQIYTIDIICYKDATKTDKVFTLSIPRGQLADTSGTSDDGILRESQTFNVLTNSQGTTKLEKEQIWSLELGAVTVDETV